MLLLLLLLVLLLLQLLLLTLLLLLMCRLLCRNGAATETELAKAVGDDLGQVALGRAPVIGGLIRLRMLQVSKCNLYRAAGTLNTVL